MVSDHHAIIPTIMIEKTDLSTLDKDQKKILTLIASRLVCATGQNHIYETMKATLLCCGYPFAAMGRIVKEEESVREGAREGRKESVLAALRENRENVRAAEKDKPEKTNVTQRKKGELSL